MLKIIIILIFSLTISFSSTNKQEKAKIYDLNDKDKEWSSFKSRHRKNYRSLLHDTQRYIFKLICNFGFYIYIYRFQYFFL
jgi:hypothetical protein